MKKASIQKLKLMNSQETVPYTLKRGFPWREVGNDVQKSQFLL